MLNLWFVPVLLRIGLLNVVWSWLIKAKIVGQPDERSERELVWRLFMQYFFAFLMACFIVWAALPFNQFHFNKMTILMFVIGGFNTWACFSHWKAAQLELALSSIFLFLDDVVAISFGYIFLAETKFINMPVSCGLILCVVTAVMLGRSKYLKTKKKKAGSLPLRFFGYVVTYGIIWGLCMFFMRAFALDGMGIGSFVFGWYGGAFLAACGFLIFKQRTCSLVFERQEFLTKGSVFLMALSAFIISTALFLAFWAMKLTPITIFKPIFFVTGQVFPALVGLYLIGEKENYDFKEKILFFSAIVAAFLVAFGFSY